jgi:C4-dicarboxylate transporter, DctM subunit
MNAYVTAGTIPGLQVEEVFRGLIPFYVADLAIVVVIFAIPDLVTFLPAMSAA